jgi:Flp pilus assembly protein TadD
LDPKNPYYHYALGSVLLQQNDPDAAIPHFQQFQTARPDDPRGRFALAVAFFDAHRADDARRELQFCLGRPETKAGALLYLGRLALQDDNLLEAERFLQQSSAVNASSPDAAVELSLVQIRRAEYDLAAKTLARVLRDAPDNYRANLHLLLLYRRTRDGRAEDQARRVAELQKAGEEREKLLLRSLDIRPY